MSAVTTKTSPVVKTEADRQLGIMPAVGSVVDRTTKLSEEVLKALETSERAAIEAVGQFVVAIEDAFSQEVAGTSDVAKKVTESVQQMADRLVRAQHDFLRNAVDSTAKSLSSSSGAKG